MKKTLALFLTVITVFSSLTFNISAVEIPQTAVSTTTAPTTQPDIEIIPPISEDVENEGLIPNISDISEENGTSLFSISSLTYLYADIENGYYSFKNRGNGLFVDIHGPNTDMIHQWSYHSGFQEIWYISKVEDNLYSIQSVYSGKYLGIENSNIGEANINQYSYGPNNFENLLWYIRQHKTTGAFVFEPYSAEGKVLTSPDANVGSELQLGNLTISRAEWGLYELDISLNGTHYIQNFQTNRFAGPYGPSTEDGTKIHQWDFGAYTQFQWIFEFNETDISYSIKNAYTGKYLGYSLEMDDSGYYYIEQYSSNTAANTRWRIRSLYDTYYLITPRDYEPYSYTLSVDPPHDSYGSYLKLVPYSYDYEYKDEWMLLPNLPYSKSIDDVWYSDSDMVMYWKSNDIAIYRKKINGSSSFDFVGNINNATSQWGSALGVNFSTKILSSNADIRIYGGTTAELEKILSVSNTTWTGLTKNGWNNGSLVRLDNGNVIKQVYEQKFADVYIKSDYSGASDATSILETTIHEMGHALGYYGHPTGNGNVMNGLNGVTILTTAEKQHLKEIYDNFAE
ncbi:MAG: RICIN domain-containing protein [Clostridia bacterium]|nr:RICIN domain-containing protein [Clostridia bacterium]